MSSDAPIVRAARVSTTAVVERFWSDEAGVPGERHAAAQLPAPQGRPAVAAAKRPANTAARPAAEAESRPSFAELEREAFTKGFQQGERAGAEAAAKRGEATLRRLAQSIEELASLRAELVHKTERQVVELAFAIARRVLRREIAVDGALLVTMARVALERLGDNTSATIRLNPDDYAMLGARAQVNEGSVVRIVPDPAVNPGGCLVQTDFGAIDAGIDAQLSEMASALGVNAVPRLGPARDAA
jgi:flagellar biosynthesis/type III secretory pathway protein FliH